VVERADPQPQAALRRLHRAVEYVNFEGVPGDVLEFAVFTGASLPPRRPLVRSQGMVRRIAGFDSFTGLPLAEIHARWQPGDCATTTPGTRCCPRGAVTPQVTLDLFAACELPAPSSRRPVADTLPRTIPAK